MMRAGPGRGRARGRGDRGLARRARRILLGLIGLVGSTSLALAHPDTAVEDRVTFLFNGAQITAIEESWTFDPGYSRSFLADYRSAPGGGISEAGSQLIAQRIQPNLAEIRYLTYVWLDGRDLGNLPVRNFLATARGGRLNFTFIVDLPAPVDPRRQALKLEIYDHDYFAAFVLTDDDPVRFRDQKGIACEPRIRNDLGNAYFGDVYPEEITLVCR